MKTLLSYILPFMFASVFFTSCEQVVDIDLPHDDQRIVINSILNPDSNFRVYVSKSLFILDNAPLGGIVDAEVLVYEDNVFIEKITENQAGAYTSASFKPSTGKAYKIEVKVPKLETVDATVVVPSHVQILSIDTNRVRIEGYDQVEVKVKFNDNSNTRDYYAIELGQTFLDYIYDENWNVIDSQYTFYAAYISLYNSINSEAYGTTIPFSDELLTGQPLSVSVLADAYIFDKSDYVGDEVVVKLKKISESYYNYILSYSKYQNTQGDPFAQPVKVFTNVNKGFGIFGASTTSVDTLFLK